ncbi:MULTISPECIES: exodeoxyribonuclease VII large subunit [unclassified Leptospira]|uniref:exodeoxyribonuclease VII large subunit n=1 Tax=unclassified Leptospira TaxID=2633828 RepID=UPI0002BD59FA|nr:MULTISPECIES: exodeoxyribonuclease VII large subunit [unclassified Leptospira]EMK02092.1 exodeoxyribonuclease VII, large subunit [Leptospira sp. B5-022]MCR1795289.1 exodeoxyribonuclease VII large subunit [Leptospira sp. id769339]
MEETKTYSVSEINSIVKQLLTGPDILRNIWIQGEISNYSKSHQGHIYFNLKDAKSLIACTFFSYSNGRYKGKPLENGMEIKAFGGISVYEPRGQYNLNISKVEELGQGDLLLQIEELKRKLAAQGVFDPERKRKLPAFPWRIGVATSPTGAAIEDIIRISKQRFPNIDILISPCLVQGDGAPESIISAINLLNDPKWDVDLIIAGRGGGSTEDLMAFNDEKVVLTFAGSRVPIISAVGHQIDSVLSDLAADHFAPTPTAAAEMAVPEMELVESGLAEFEVRLKTALKNQAGNLKEKLRILTNKKAFLDPRSMLNDRILQLDEINSRIHLLGKNYLMGAQNKFSPVSNGLLTSFKSQLERKKKEFQLLSGKLDGFSPLGTLKRGYSVVRKKGKKVVTSPVQLEKEEELEVILAEGRIRVSYQGEIK